MDSELPRAAPDVNVDTDTRQRENLISQLHSLLAQGIPLSTVARLVGAAAYLQERASRSSKAGPITNLQVRTFIEEEVRAERVYLPQSIEWVDQTVLPPDLLEIQRGGDSAMELPGAVPRTRYLMELLGSLKQEYRIILGTSEPSVFRGDGYVIFDLPSLGKLVFVCDQAENATFVVFQPQQDEPLAWNRYIGLTKSQLSQLANVRALHWQDDVATWQRRLHDYLVSADPPSASKRQSETKEQRLEASQRAKAVERASEGWRTQRAISLRSGRSRELVKERLEKLSNQYPGEVRAYRDVYGRVFTHFGPSIVRAYEAQESSARNAPTGWRTANALNAHLKKGWDLSSYATMIS